MTVYAGQLGRYILEKLLHVDSDLGTGLHEVDLQFFGPRLTLLCLHFPLFGVVYFVAHQVDVQVLPSDCPRLVDPALHIVEAGLGSDVVADDCDRRVVDVAGNQGAEPLLACRVPQLQPHHLVIHVHCLRQKVDSDCGLSQSLG